MCDIVPSLHIFELFLFLLQKGEYMSLDKLTKVSIFSIMHKICRLYHRWLKNIVKLRVKAFLTVVVLWKR